MQRPVLRLIQGGKRRPQLNLVRVESAAAVVRAIYWTTRPERRAPLRLVGRV